MGKNSTFFCSTRSRIFRKYIDLEWHTCKDDCVSKDTCSQALKKNKNFFHQIIFRKIKGGGQVTQWRKNVKFQGNRNFWPIWPESGRSIVLVLIHCLHEGIFVCIKIHRDIAFQSQKTVEIEKRGLPPPLGPFTGKFDRVYLTCK